MSQIRKFDPGGSVDKKKKLEAKVLEELAKRSFSREDEPGVRESLQAFLEWDLQNPDDIQYQNLTNKYSTTNDNLKGSDEPLRESWWTGKVKIKNGSKEQYNTAASEIFMSAKEALKLEEVRGQEELQLKAANAPKKTKVSLAAFDDAYIGKFGFDPSEDFSGTNEDRKAKIFQMLPILTQEYLKNSEKNIETAEYDNLEGVTVLDEAVKTGDYSQVSSAALKLG